MITTIMCAIALVLGGFVYYECHVAKRRYEKEIKELKQTIAVYDTSERVIKNCVVYTPEEPVTIDGDHMAFIGCKFENLGRNQATKALREILGLKA